jgi:galactokinase
VGVAAAMLRAADEKLSPVALATLCRQAEQEYAGSPCGIMDQLCCTSARAGHALLIDCRSMVMEQIPLAFDAAAMVLIDSGVRHSIAGSEYARRRRECSAALATLNEVDSSITSLRDVDESRIPILAEHLDDTLARRVRHVVSENARVARAADALRTGDARGFGRLMNESHASLRDPFDVSCEELDEIVSIAQGIDGVYGARLTGGGFGGCVIVMASIDAVVPLESAIRESYDGRYEAPATVFPVRSADATALLGHTGYPT